MHGTRYWEAGRALKTQRGSQSPALVAAVAPVTKATADVRGDKKPNPKDSGIRALGEWKGVGSRMLCMSCICSKCNKEQCLEKHATPEGGDEKEYDRKMPADFTGLSSRPNSPAPVRKQQGCK